MLYKEGMLRQVIFWILQLPLKTLSPPHSDILNYWKKPSMLLYVPSIIFSSWYRIGCAPPLRRASTADCFTSKGVDFVKRREIQGALRGSLRQAFKHISVIWLQASSPFSLQPPTVIWTSIQYSDPCSQTHWKGVHANNSRPVGQMTQTCRHVQPDVF